MPTVYSNRNQRLTRAGLVSYIWAALLGSKSSFMWRNTPTQISNKRGHDNFIDIYKCIEWIFMHLKARITQGASIQPRLSCMTSSPIRACSVNPQSKGIGGNWGGFYPLRVKILLNFWFRKCPPGNKFWSPDTQNQNSHQVINPSYQTLKINGLSLFGAFVVAFCY